MYLIGSQYNVLIFSVLSNFFYNALRVFLLSFGLSFGQSSTCENAAAMCSGNQGPFNNTTGVASFGSLGCLVSTPNPAWFYMQVGTSGNMNFQLSQIRTSNGLGIDVDFILWGPFNSLSGICNNLALYSPGYTGANNVVDCSYLPDPVENVNIPNAVAGQYYMLLVTNFSNQPGTYSLNQTGGTGALSCDIVCGVRLGPDRILCGAATNVTLTATFLQAPSLPGTPVYSWFRNGVFQYTTTTNTTVVNQSGTWRVSVTRPGCSDIAIDEIEVQFGVSTPFNNVGPISSPAGQCNPVFDLTLYEAAIVAPYNPASFTFQYFDMVTGLIANPSAFTTNSSTTIRVVIENGGCGTDGFIDVIVDCVPPTCTIDLASTAGTTNQVLCLGLPIENIVYTTTGSATGATVTGLPTGLTSVYNANTFTISGTPTQTGTFNYTVTTVGCSVNASRNGTITVVAVPVTPTIVSNAPTCLASGTSTVFNYDTGVTYVFNPGGPFVGAGGVISGMVTGTNYTVLANNGTCSSAPSVAFNNAAQLSIPNTPIIIIATATCLSSEVARIDNYVTGLQYIFSPTGPTVNASGVILGMNVGTNYEVTASNGSCSSPVSAPFSINAMLAAPDRPTIISVAPTCLADGTSRISNYDSSLVYTFSPNDATVGAGGVISGMVTGTTYTVFSYNGTCNSATSLSFVNNEQLSSPIAPTLSVVNATVCSGERAIFQINGAANNVITYSINGGSDQTVTLTAAGVATVEVVSSTTLVSIELLNISNGCSLALSDVASVTVQPCSIPKGISPNGDNLNDELDLSFYNIEKLEIFNRYGSKVYSKSNYEDEWHGQSDNGNELPDGTYYYVIDFTDIETKTGWIYINRERK